jgi:hypothetical protein
MKSRNALVGLFALIAMATGCLGQTGNSDQQPDTNSGGPADWDTQALATLYASETQTVTAGCTIRGRVWEDLNQNGVMDEGEPAYRGCWLY